MARGSRPRRPPFDHKFTTPTVISLGTTSPPIMGKGKMDEAAAARIRKARGEKVRHVDDEPGVSGLTDIFFVAG